jgi:hypothetical protein
LKGLLEKPMIMDNHAVFIGFSVPELRRNIELSLAFLRSHGHSLGTLRLAFSLRIEVDSGVQVFLAKGYRFKS